MNLSEKMLLFAISETQPATFAELSIRSQMATEFLSLKLDDLTDRGFIRIWNGEYSLARGVKEAILQ